MFCRHCGTRLPEGSKFCSKCGQQVVDNVFDKTEIKPNEVKPTEVKPTEVKPTDVKPTDVKPTPIEATPVTPTPVEATPVTPTPIEPTPIVSGLFSPRLRFASIMTIVLAVYGVVYGVISLLFGIGWLFYVMAALMLALFIITMTAYNKIPLDQSDLDAFTEHYRQKIKDFDSKPEGVKERYTFHSVAEVKGLNRLNCCLAPMNKMWFGLLFIPAILGGILGTIFTVAGLSGFATDLDGVYVQATASYSGGGVDQVGKTAYKVEGDKIYYAAVYEGGNTGWGGPYYYSRLGTKVTYTFTGGGMRSTHTLYFVNMGHDISGDMFGFSIAYSRV